MQKYSDMVCRECGKPNPNKYQDVCLKPECGGQMVVQDEYRRAACLKRDLDFLKAVILTCPLCDKVMKIEDPRSNRFKAVCDCSKWRVDFKISEI